MNKQNDRLIILTAMDHRRLVKEMGEKKSLQTLLYEYEHDPDLRLTTVNCLFCAHLFVGEERR